MKYIQHRSSYKRKQHAMPWKVIAGIAFGALLLISFFIIFSGKKDIDLEQSEQVEVVDQQGEYADVMVEVVSLEGQGDEPAQEYEEITLTAVDGSGSSGIARRGQSNELFTHVVVASLPAIDAESYFYEGWLVKPGIVDYFSTGEMFAREDGKWGLVWEVDLLESSYHVEEFISVVITLEPRDNDPAPSTHHVLEGEF